ncbi:class D beta-lactamase [Gymnodinialimonas sp. 57CJ19]|uniref:class D beta-lactamase n=1 Tax=Gymnodinialimonas sp. 57CJ19 TaxID=3138498 RepID=UPI0031345192
MPKQVIAGALTGLCLSVSAAQAETICTLIASPSAQDAIYEVGDCDRRVTPASTFKVALSLMAFHDGVLLDAHTPTLPYQSTYPDWGGENLRQATDPDRWMTYSVVWFSRQITPLLSLDRMTELAQGMGYGNADFSGDYGQNNALERAWMTSSLLISPREQVAFLSRMIQNYLPISGEAVAQTIEIMDYTDTPGGWRIYGKTGAAYPRMESGAFDYAQGWGWYVGWASNGDTTLVFAHLTQDETRHQTSPGIRAREAFLAGFEALANGALQ